MIAKTAAWALTKTLLPAPLGLLSWSQWKFTSYLDEECQVIIVTRVQSDNNYRGPDLENLSLILVQIFYIFILTNIRHI